MIRNLHLDGKRVKDLPELVDYNTLREAIRRTTGIEILKRKDMKFQQSGRKKYAYIDATQVQDDCRVTLKEIKNGWRPSFAVKLEFSPEKASLDAQIQAASASTVEKQRSGRFIGQEPERE